MDEVTLGIPGDFENGERTLQDWMRKSFFFDQCLIGSWKDAFEGGLRFEGLDDDTTGTDTREPDPSVVRVSYLNSLGGS